MERAVHVEVVSKTPPGGRCEFYDRIFFYLVKVSKNLYYTLIPYSLYGKDVNSPAVLVNGKEVVPEDGILLTWEELVKALKEAGVEFRKEEERIKNWFEEEYEKLLGGA